MTDEAPKRGRGRPWPKPEAKAPRGRPRYLPRAEQHQMVEHLLAVGESQADIAGLLGIAEGTFRAKFAKEITDARLRLRAGFVAVVIEKAMGGNATMLRLAMDLTGLPDAAVPYKVPEVEEAKPEPMPAKLGKKAQQALDAANPDTATPMGRLMAARAQGSRVQ